MLPIRNEINGLTFEIGFWWLVVVLSIVAVLLALFRGDGGE